MQLSNLLTDRSRRAEEAWTALCDCIPVVLGVVPFGITCGIMGFAAKMSGAETIAMSVFVFAGASQFIGITMLGAGVTAWGIIIVTTLMVNLRHLIMGSSLAPYMIKLPLPFQALLAFFLTDEAYALTISRIHKNGYSVLYQLTVSTVLYLAWVSATAAGVVLSSYISDPLTWGLDFAMPATFLVLLIPLLKDRTSLIVFGISAAVSVFAAQYLPGKWYIIIACLTASLVGGLSKGDSKHAQ
ncbi:AzlC family ABC transporter permease [Desulfosporosinus sp. PR]|uniref:AzlC family ABC transporter permease n=1 Tax=Candidatus Desulfosporosinus nitrosoreducens TaxID=3401928 RepID=UPI0027F623F6|nr:AzlC family ABC transporter permease [Desulfosporosinus sp. PR]MDQ7092627.1 AzlC family ABC transporter permease [Desulfosporosinus sp. PR]